MIHQNSIQVELEMKLKKSISKKFITENWEGSERRIESVMLLFNNINRRWSSRSFIYVFEYYVSSMYMYIEWEYLPRVNVNVRWVGMLMRSKIRQVLGKCEWPRQSNKVNRGIMMSPRRGSSNWRIRTKWTRNRNKSNR